MGEWGEEQSGEWEVGSRGRGRGGGGRGGEGERTGVKNKVVSGSREQVMGGSREGEV